MTSRLMKLRDPAAVRWAARRRYLSFRLGRLNRQRCPGLLNLGTEYGGWVIPGGMLETDWIVWSLGAGHDVSFDVEALRRGVSRVRSFDPVARHLDSALEQTNRDRRFTTHNTAVAGHDGLLRVSGDPSADHGYIGAGTDGVFDVRARTIKTLLDELGDAQIHLLKMDIEGAEYAVLETSDLSRLGVRILCVEFHATVGVATALRAVERIRQRFEVVAVSGCDVTFVERAALKRLQQLPQ